jgi:hypothetical protein
MAKAKSSLWCSNFLSWCVVFSSRVDLGVDLLQRGSIGRAEEFSAGSSSKRR